MRLEVRLEPERPGILPLHYRESLQALIYRHLPYSVGQPLHDGQYWPSERPLKLFVFSQLQGAVRYHPGRGVEVTGPVWFRFASPDRALALGLATGLLHFGQVRLAALDFAVREIATLALPEIGETVVVRALSPITVYRTLTVEGRRRTQYYNPLNEEFGQLIEANLVRKARTLGLLPVASADSASNTGEGSNEREGEHATLPTQSLSFREGVDHESQVASVSEGASIPLVGRGALLFQIEPLGVHPRAKRLECYKGTWIEGWVGRFRLRGRPELLRLALEAGLGAKNSQGFGYVEEIIDRQREDGRP